MTVILTLTPIFTDTLGKRSRCCVISASLSEPAGGFLADFFVLDTSSEEAVNLVIIRGLPATHVSRWSDRRGLCGIGDCPSA